MPSLWHSISFDISVGFLSFHLSLSPSLFLVRHRQPPQPYILCPLWSIFVAHQTKFEPKTCNKLSFGLVFDFFFRLWFVRVHFFCPSPLPKQSHQKHKTNLMLSSLHQYAYGHGWDRFVGLSQNLTCKQYEYVKPLAVFESTFFLLFSVLLFRVISDHVSFIKTTHPIHSNACWAKQPCFLCVEYFRGCVRWSAVCGSILWMQATRHHHNILDLLSPLPLHLWNRLPTKLPCTTAIRFRRTVVRATWSGATLPVSHICTVHRFCNSCTMSLFVRPRFDRLINRIVWWNRGCDRHLKTAFHCTESIPMPKSEPEIRPALRQWPWLRTKKTSILWSLSMISTTFPPCPNVIRTMDTCVSVALHPVALPNDRWAKRSSRTMATSGLVESKAIYFIGHCKRAHLRYAGIFKPRSPFSLLHHHSNLNTHLVVSALL